MPARSRNLFIPGVIVLAVAVALAYIVLFSGGQSGSDGAEPLAQEDFPPGVVSEVVEPFVPSEVNVERREDGDPLALGPVDAPVVMVRYTDFQCAFCALWTEQTLPELAEYIDAGQLRLETRDIAVFGPDSRRAALAAYAAGLQGEYYEFADALFADGQVPAPSALTDAALEDAASRLGLDLTRFNDDRSSAEVETAVERNITEAQDHGVFSTPSFLIGGEPIVGSQPTEVFLEAVQAHLP